MTYIGQETVRNFELQYRLVLTNMHRGTRAAPRKQEGVFHIQLIFEMLKLQLDSCKGE